MGCLSKFLVNSNDLPMGIYIRENEETDIERRKDYHMWVQDKDGNIVYDPELNFHKDCCNDMKLDINKPVYAGWYVVMGKECGEFCRNFNYGETNLTDIYKKLINKEISQEKRFLAMKSAMNPEEYKCGRNASDYYIAKSDTNLDLVIGSQGWKYLNNDTEAFWCFGSERDYGTDHA